MRFCFFVCLLFFFLMWMNCKVLSEFVTMLLLFYVLVPCPRGMWNPCSLIRDQTCTPCTGKQSLYQWTIREVPCLLTWLYLFKMIWELPTRIYHKVISGDVPGGDVVTVQGTHHPVCIVSVVQRWLDKFI